MSEVFISYAHSAAPQARRAAETLRALGYSVWLDDDLPAHRAFTHEIERQLTAAKAALVIWSADSVRSEWVLSEANRAREAHKLVQLTIDGARLPMPFDQIHCADLSGWSGEGQHPAWKKVEASIADLVRGGVDDRVAPNGVVAPAKAAEPLLAVLAFDNLSGDPEMAYFSDGVSEEILQTVARGTELRVIARASSFQFRGADKAAAKVAAALRATHVLDGSVRRAGSTVRIAANLIACADETTLWSERYDRDLTDILALQDEIATSVAAALKSALARSHPTPIDPAAYDLFLRATSPNAESHPEAGIRRVKMLEEVVARAPGFARGWADLAGGTAFGLRNYRGGAVAAGLTGERALEAAEMALRLDPHMGRAYQALTLLEPPAAYSAREALNDKALASASNDDAVLALAARFYGEVGRLRQGLAFARRLYDLDPLSPIGTSVLGNQLTVAGRLEEAESLYDAARARWPEYANLAATAITVAARHADGAKLEGVIRAWSAAVVGNAWLQGYIWIARNLIDPDPQAIKDYLERQRAELARTGTASLLGLVWLNVLGQKDEAYELVDKASFAYMFDRTPAPSDIVENRILETRAVYLYPGGIFSSFLTPDPRFPRLCAKLGLVDYWIETDKWPDCANEVPYDFRTEVRKAAAAGLVPRV
jgi:TolB-like protein/tetratricopeptide (TPR) repeat protein